MFVNLDWTEFDATLAHTLLTELGAAGEDVGLNRLLKTNTSMRCALLHFRKLMNAFARRIGLHPFMSPLIEVTVKLWEPVGRACEIRVSTNPYILTAKDAHLQAAQWRADASA